MNFAERFSIGSSETSRMSFSIFYQLGTIFKSLLDCAQLDNIQRFMHRLTVAITLLLYSVLTIFYDIICSIYMCACVCVCMCQLLYV